MRMSSAPSRGGESHFLTVGLGYPVCKKFKKELQQGVSKLSVGTKIPGPHGHGNQGQQEGP